METKTSNNSGPIQAKQMTLISDGHLLWATGLRSNTLLWLGGLFKCAEGRIGQYRTRHRRESQVMNLVD